MDRRKFLKGSSIVLCGIIAEQTIPFNRVWSFPSKIVIPKFKKGNWTIEDDWTDLDKYSVLHDVVMMPEKADRDRALMFNNTFTNGYAILVPPELKQVAQQILKGLHRQKDRLTLSVINESRFKYSNV